MWRIAVASILLGIGVHAAARDVATEQAAAQYARQEMERATAEHKAATDQVARTKKALEQLKLQYEQEQKKASLSEKKMREAAARFREADEALDRAWKQ